jgi:hypothetical protein
MHVKPFQPCCKEAAIQAFLQHSYYLIGCHFCGLCFSITHDLQHFLQQVIASYEMKANYPLNFDIVPFNGRIIYMLP